MIRTVYIETTIPSYYYETRRTVTALAWREATRRWWERYRAGYTLLTSKYVLAELGAAPVAKRTRMLKLVEGIPLLDESPGLDDVVAYYIGHHLMPADAQVTLRIWRWLPCTGWTFS